MSVLRQVFAAVLVVLGSVATQAENAQLARVRMDTTLGAIELELYADRAPITVANFLGLIDGGHFDGAAFYRVVTVTNDRGSPPIQVIQGGLGEAGEAFAGIAHESTAASGILHRNGVISMARAAPGTASTEFFICIGDQPALDYGGRRNADLQGFAAFGRVTSGMPVVHRIQQQPTDSADDTGYTAGQMLLEPVAITRMTRIR